MVLVPVDEESLSDMLERLQDQFEGAPPPIVIQLNLDTWAENDMVRIERRFGDQVVRSNLRNGDGGFRCPQGNGKGNPYHPPE